MIMICPSWRMHHRALGSQKPQLLSPDNVAMANRFSSLYLCWGEVPTLCIGSHVILHLPRFNVIYHLLWDGPSIINKTVHKFVRYSIVN
jgi:hypothetical protein